MANKDQKNNGEHAKATTLQILGGTKHAPRIDPKWKTHYDLLIDLRAQLDKRKGGLSEIAREEQKAFSLHMADAGTDEFDRDFALSMISSDQNALYEIEAALNRIRTNTYGICELTGQPIEAERLAAIPWTRFSADAQRELEATGSVARTRLAARGSWNEPSASESEEGGEGEAEAA
jgi:RNA polymerase-binding transcription factor DksA